MMASDSLSTEMMDSDSEDEIFFGPVTAKEEQIAKPLQNRKTEIFVPGPGMTCLYRRSSVPSLASLEEEESKINSAAAPLFQSSCTQDSEVSVNVVGIEGNGKTASNGDCEGVVSNNGNIVLDGMENDIALPSSNLVDAGEISNKELHVTQPCILSIECDQEKLSCVIPTECEKELPCAFLTEHEEKLPLNALKVSSDVPVAPASNVNESVEITSIYRESLEEHKEESFVLTHDGSSHSCKDAIRNQSDSEERGESQLVASEKCNSFVTVDNSLQSLNGECVPLAKDGNDIIYYNYNNCIDVTDNENCSGEVGNNNCCSVEVVNNESCSGEVSNSEHCSSEVANNEHCSGEVADDKSCGGEVSDSVCCSGEVADNESCGGEVDDNEHCSGEVADNKHCIGEVANNELCSGEVADNKYCSGKVADNERCTSEVSNNECCSSEVAGNDCCSSDVTDNKNYSGEVVDNEHFSEEFFDNEHCSIEVAKNKCCSSEVDENEHCSGEVVGNEHCSGEVIDNDPCIGELADNECCSGEVANNKRCIGEVADNEHCSSEVVKNEHCSSKVADYQVKKSDSLVCASEKPIAFLSEEGSSSIVSRSMSEQGFLPLHDELNNAEPAVTHTPFLPGSKMPFGSNVDQIDSSAESYGTNNKGLILSQTPNLESRSFSSDFSCSASTAKTQSMDSFKNSSPHVDSFDYPYSAESSHAQSSSHREDEGTVSKNSSIKDEHLYDVSSDESDSDCKSPTRRFNDTIEEMEMLLKYGVNYGEAVAVEKGACNFEPRVDIPTDEQSGNQEGESKHDDSIVSPRKFSVMSTVSNFNPEFNSTQVPKSDSQSVPQSPKSESNSVPQSPKSESNSVPQSPKSESNSVPQTPKSGSNSVPQSPTKGVPPPKPPRNIKITPGNLSRSTVKTSTPKDRLQTSVTPKLSRLQKPVRKDTPCLPRIVSRLNPSTPRSATVSRTRPSNFTPTSDSRKMTRAPNTVTGATRTISIMNAPKGCRLQSSTPIMPASIAARRKSSNFISSKHLTPLAQQKVKSAVEEKNSGRSGLPPHSGPSRCREKLSSGQTPRLLNRDKLGGTPYLNKDRLGSTPRPNKDRLGGTPCQPLIKKHLRQGGLDIVSPVARYLRENPPPPLVVNVKPRHKIQSEVGKGTQAQPSTETGEPKVTVTKQKRCKTPVLPVAMYSSAVPVLLDDVDNKENERFRHRQEIPSGNQHVYVMKHKGRVKLPKDAVQDGLTESTSPKGYNRSPTNFKPSTVPAACQSPSLRGSLMEVSLYEPHRTKYSHTLK